LKFSPNYIFWWGGGWLATWLLRGKWWLGMSDATSTKSTWNDHFAHNDFKPMKKVHYTLFFFPLFFQAKQEQHHHHLYLCQTHQHHKHLLRKPKKRNRESKREQRIHISHQTFMLLFVLFPLSSLHFDFDCCFHVYAHLIWEGKMVDWKNTTHFGFLISIFFVQYIFCKWEKHYSGSCFFGYF